MPILTTGAASTLAFVLQALGLNPEESEAMEVLDRNFDQVFEEQPA
jgi:hypothetical protein